MTECTKKAPVAGTTDVRSKSNEFTTSNYITLDGLKSERKFIADQLLKEPISSPVFINLVCWYEALNHVVATNQWRLY